MNQGHKLSQEEIKHNEDIELLKDYLSQYTRARRRRVQLERRLKAICDEMAAPVGGQGYSPINRPKNQISEGAASFVIRKSEQETRIEEQRDEIAKDLLKIMDIFDYLDKNSDERNALELYYIDNLKWERVALEMHTHRNTALNYAKKGLEKLLTFKRVKRIIYKYRDDREKG